MSSLSRLLQQLQDSSDDSSDADSSSDDETGGLVHLLALSAAARATADVASGSGDAVARALAGLVVLEGLRGALRDDGSIRTGDMVRLKTSVDAVKKLQEGHGGWNTDMAKDLGKVGSVVKVADINGDAVVHFGKKTWRLNPDTCDKVTADEKKEMYSMGDKVYVEFTDTIAEEMQKAHGGWNSLMSGDLQKIGKVMGVDDDGDISVQFSTRCWRINATACQLLATETGGTIGVGDKVFLDNDVDLEMLKAMQDGHGGWNAHLAQDLGHVGEVISIDKDGDLHVKVGKHKWFLNPFVCTKILKKFKAPFKVGQRVIIEMEPEEFLKLQIGHGGVNASMLTDLGKVGKILEILPDKDLMIQFTPNVWSLNPAICTSLSDTTKPKFAVGDKVFISLDADIVKMLQEGHGGFTQTLYRLLGQMGKVCKILPTGDIVVLYGILPMILNPAIVSCFIPEEAVSDGSAASAASTSPFSVGELVHIDMDVEQVKKQQEGHGGWNDAMHKLIGKVGIILKIDSDGDLHVCYGDSVACLNPAVCSQAKTSAVENNAGQSASASGAAAPSVTITQPDSSQAPSMKCEACRKKNVSVVFGCGHASCDVCSKTLKNCHSCQGQITLRTNLFF